MSRFTDRLRKDASEMADKFHHANVKNAAIVIDEMEAAIRDFREWLNDECGCEMPNDMAEKALRRLEELSK